MSAGSPAGLLRRAPGWHLLLSVAAAARVEVALRRRSLAATAAMLGLDVAAAPWGASALGDAPRPAGHATPAGPARHLPRWAEQPVRATTAVMRRWPLGQDGPRGSAMCLRSSLVTAWRLRSLDPVVRIGVAMDPVADAGAGPALRAHAWVEVDGRALDPTAARYRVMTSLLPARPARARSAAR